MQLRRLRLGDVLDDYCPRERRITNHAVVAMIDDQVKQTRCTTCDAEHEYKEAKVPAPRRKKAATSSHDLSEPLSPRPTLAPASASLAPQDLPDAPADGEQPAASAPLDTAHPTLGDTHPAPMDTASPALVNPSPEEMPVAAVGLAEDEATSGPLEDEGPVHRPLIRATLPRPEGQSPERKAPDFTFRQSSGRGFDGNRNGHRQRASRAVRQGGQGQGQGQGQGSGQSRFGSGSRHGAGQGTSSGQRQSHRPGNTSGQRGSRPSGQNRGPRQGSSGQGRKRGR